MELSIKETCNNILCLVKCSNPILHSDYFLLRMTVTQYNDTTL